MDFVTAGVGAVRGRPLLFDANVLIDYGNADYRIMTLSTEHLGPAMVPSPVLEEAAIRGLRPLIKLVHMGKLDRPTAVNWVRRIHDSNPYHISTGVLEQFVDELPPG